MLMILVGVEMCSHRWFLIQVQQIFAVWNSQVCVLGGSSTVCPLPFTHTLVQVSICFMTGSCLTVMHLFIHSFIHSFIRFVHLLLCRVVKTPPFYHEALNETALCWHWKPFVYLLAFVFLLQFGCFTNKRHALFPPACQAKKVLRYPRNGPVSLPTKFNNRCCNHKTPA